MLLELDFGLKIWELSVQATQNTFLIILWN